MSKLGKAATTVIMAAALLVLGNPGSLWASSLVPVPEIDPSTGLAAMTLIAGAILVIRSRRKK